MLYDVYIIQILYDGRLKFIIYSFTGIRNSDLFRKKINACITSETTPH